MQTTLPRLCKICRNPISGRPDKIFCTVNCKNVYHHTLRSVTIKAAKEVDKILHRNRSILLEIMGKNAVQMKVNRAILDKKNFKYDYITGFYINSKNKMYHKVYDFTWMLFGDGEVLINRKTKKQKPAAKS